MTAILLALFYLLYPGEHITYAAPGGLYQLEYRAATPEACAYRVTELGGPYTFEGVIARGAEARATARIPALVCDDLGLYAEGTQWQEAAWLTGLPVVWR